MIELIQGTPGSGKSAVALAMGIAHLLDGGALATNFDLVPHWAWILSGQAWRVRCGLVDRMERAIEYRRRCFRVGTADTIFDLSAKLSTCGLTPEYLARREGKGLLILDEAQLVFNSRDFSKNKRWIEFFTQHRKLGWNVLLVAHHQMMIDKQIRPLIEIETRFRNLKNIRLPLLPIPLSPVNAFLAVRFYAGHGPGTGMIHSRHLSFLDMTTAGLYDTLRVFAFDDCIQEIEQQGLDPYDSVSAIPSHLPDFFLGKKYGAYMRSHLDKPKIKKKEKAKRPPPPRPEPGQARNFY